MNFYLVEIQTFHNKWVAIGQFRAASEKNAIAQAARTAQSLPDFHAIRAELAS